MTGDVLLALGLVDVETARPHLPSNLPIVPAAPGRTLGGVMLASYHGSSPLHYEELIVFGGVVRAGWRPGLWVSHIYVNDHSSVSGGRGIWGMPKIHADFAIEGKVGDGTVEVRHGEDLLVRVSATRARFHWPQPLAVPLLSGLDREADHRFTLGRGLALLGAVRARVKVPSASPIASLGFPARAPAVTGHARSLLMKAPTHLRREPSWITHPTGG